MRSICSAQRVLLTLLVTACAIAAAGCAYEWQPRRSVVRTLRFEASCADALCGFRVDRGTAESTTSLLPGEHGMRLVAGARVTTGISLTTASTSEGVRFVARCDSSAQLVVAQTAYVWRGELGDAGEGTRALVGEPTSRRVAVRAEWEQHEVRFDARAAEDFSERLLLHFEVEGQGQCVIDEVEYATYDPTLQTRTSR